MVRRLFLRIFDFSMLDAEIRCIDPYFVD